VFSNVGVKTVRVGKSDVVVNYVHTAYGTGNYKVLESLTPDQKSK